MEREGWRLRHRNKRAVRQSREGRIGQQMSVGHAAKKKGKARESDESDGRSAKGARLASQYLGRRAESTHGHCEASWSQSKDRNQPRPQPRRPIAF